MLSQTQRPEVDVSPTVRGAVQSNDRVVVLWVTHGLQAVYGKSKLVSKMLFEI